MARGGEGLFKFRRAGRSIDAIVGAKAIGNAGGNDQVITSDGYSREIEQRQCRSRDRRYRTVCT